MLAALDVGVPDPARVTVVQISDSHLLQSGSGRLLGVPTGESLRRVLRDIRKRYPEVDVIVHSGDIAQDGHSHSYRQFSRILRCINVPVLCIPGNHDDRAAITNALRPGSPTHVNRSVRAGAWLIVTLDTMVPNEDYGSLSDLELRRLHLELGCHARMPTLIFLHHPPVMIKSAWMDSMALRNAQRLFAIVDEHPQVRILAWGHNHQAFDTWRQRQRLLGVPATCFQYKPGCAEFALDAVAPGYRVFQLFGDGAFDTDVVRVPHAWFPTESDRQSDCKRNDGIPRVRLGDAHD